MIDMIKNRLNCRFFIIQLHGNVESLIYLSGPA